MSTQALKHFQTVDPVLATAAQAVWPVELKWRAAADFFAALCNEIVSQQLSDKVADVLYGRLNQVCAGRVTAAKIIRLTDQQLRDTGMSWSKVKFIKNLATAVTTKAINLNQLTTLEDELVVAELTKLPGIGPWTAEMFLMFSLGREDVFSHGDLGLRRAIKKLYGFPNEPTHSQLEAITSKWSPYRTYACLVLWKIGN
jgi:DNA-3-methyladenine glycosylase II